jgi:hypothetical protein
VSLNVGRSIQFKVRKVTACEIASCHFAPISFILPKPSKRRTRPQNNQLTNPLVRVINRVQSRNEVSEDWNLDSIYASYIPCMRLGCDKTLVRTVGKETYGGITALTARTRFTTPFSKLLSCSVVIVPLMSSATRD